MQKTITEKLKKWSGKISFENIAVNGEEAEAIQNTLANAVDIAPQKYTELLNRLKELSGGVKEKVFYNKIVAVGRECFSRRLINDTTYTGVINYGAVGTGSAAVSDSDTVLDTEVKRKGVATRARSGNVVTLRFFYSKADVSGTLNEFGTFIDGTSTVDTGQMFNRALTGGWVKSASEALSVSVQFNLNTV